MSVDWALMAMAHAKTGDSVGARRWLEKSLASAELPQWQQQVELRALQKEASNLINSLAP